MTERFAHPSPLTLGFERSGQMGQRFATGTIGLIAADSERKGAAMTYGYPSSLLLYERVEQ